MNYDSIKKVWKSNIADCYLNKITCQDLKVDILI